MSDININLDGLIAFLAAAAVGILLVFGMLAGSAFAAMKAHQKHEPFTQQRFFPHLIGMSGGLLCCLGIELLLLFTDSNLPPRNIPLWLDRWVLLWLPAVLALWPLTVYFWLRKRPRLEQI